MPSCDCPDNAAILYESLRRLFPENDLVITTGGVASGQKDVLRTVATRIAMENNGSILD
jgi:molybdopterin biosynthesis enzyme